MTAARKKSRSHARQKPKSKGGVKSSLQWRREKRPSRGRLVAKHVEEIDDALKWKGKFE
jgi:hypothetical protein